MRAQIIQVKAFSKVLVTHSKANKYFQSKKKEREKIKPVILLQNTTFLYRIFSPSNVQSPFN